MLTRIVDKRKSEDIIVTVKFDLLVSQFWNYGGNASVYEIIKSKKNSTRVSDANTVP